MACKGEKHAVMTGNTRYPRGELLELWRLRRTVDTVRNGFEPPNQKVSRGSTSKAVLLVIEAVKPRGLEFDKTLRTAVLRMLSPFFYPLQPPQHPNLPPFVRDASALFLSSPSQESMICNELCITRVCRLDTQYDRLTAKSIRQRASILLLASFTA